MTSPITVRLGRRARERIAANALQAADVAIAPAAAGGPKGLILNGIDCWLFGSWLTQAPRQRALVRTARHAPGAIVLTTPSGASGLKYCFEKATKMTENFMSEGGA